ncbi:dTDP-4-dehydrorhamnose reductase [Candidatus Neptunochlamydia vexilliferae]|uniref:dTDP-4-dehydrorhamnose reductase n=1 Tax=Candidatus Neptunichlamydia vexilliferae TaxID=1651774 RepID=A0ABS0B0C9_9BACT|nr:dTDP-4-dehydrorhamnose reductase [Candidatus Neptunochlamydia vexilliferae]MBF5059843.1 dTDP-4-dehydrorhamnose reductase [Candidatus Neptunochlamydia vexilliferae]
MKLWIIGKRGLLASAMRRKCLEKGIDHVATTRKEVDVEDEKSVRAQFETMHFTHVINCSGYTAVDQAEEEEARAFALNRDAVALLAKLAQEHGKKLIHFSTDYVFDGEKEGYQTGDPTAPLSIYGKSKEAGEKELHPEACLIRTSWLFGQEGSHFVKTMIRLMEQQETLSVVNDQKGRPTYADDLAEAALSLLDASGTFHFANEGETTWHGFAETIKRKLEEKNHPLRCHTIEPVTSEKFGKAKRPASSILLTENLQPPHWEKGLEEVLAHAFES